MDEVSQRWVRSWLPHVTIALLALLAMGNMGLLDASRWGRGIGNIAIFSTSLFPPNAAVLPALSRAMLETLQIAFVGTLLGFVMALPLALPSTRTLFPLWITTPLKVFLGIVRTVPSLLWAIVFVVAFGLGPRAGALGIAFYTLGYLGKLYYEAFEGIDQEVTEAVRSVGCNRLQLMRYALLPEAANTILSQLLFIFEYNVRASSIMGFVGAGGIGFYLLGYVQLLQYQNLMMALLVTLVVVILIDQVSARVRGLVLPALSQPS
ncbi:MAG: phosphonate ABC transporter, permease protein PhnE [Chloroflexi bacterium]|nr:phosphonate ABC transporter, permease protein PhnE [Chloroflexota bacterium]